jgi:hypothetical protein
MSLDTLLPELYHLIVGADSSVYRALFTSHAFREKITIGEQLEYMEQLGYDYQIRNGVGMWLYQDKPHRAVGPTIDDGLRKEYYHYGKKDRLDGPAVIDEFGNMTYYYNGTIHRDGDEPAYIGVDGTKKWYRFGMLHRLGGPAVLLADSTQIWMIDGKVSNLYGPAIVTRDGYQLWLQQGLLQSTGDEPALVCPSGNAGWYDQGVYMPHQHGYITAEERIQLKRLMFLTFGMF